MPSETPLVTVQGGFGLKVGFLVSLMKRQISTINNCYYDMDVVSPEIVVPSQCPVCVYVLSSVL